MTKSKVINIILAIAVIALIAGNITQCGNASDAVALSNAKDDTIQSYINKNGEQVSTIAILHGSVADLEQLNAKQGSELQRLQKLVDKHTISATVHGTVTGNTVSNITTITKLDTIEEHDSIKVYPVYATNFENKWEKFNVTATKDSFKIDYKVFNKFDYVVRYNKDKWYKARVPEITVTNLNPNTETVELKNFTVKPPKNQKIIVFLGGALAGVASSVFVAKMVSK